MPDGIFGTRRSTMLPFRGRILIRCTQMRYLQSSACMQVQAFSHNVLCSAVCCRHEQAGICKERRLEPCAWTTLHRAGAYTGCEQGSQRGRAGTTRPARNQHGAAHADVMAPRLLGRKVRYRRFALSAVHHHHRRRRWTGTTSTRWLTTKADDGCPGLTTTACLVRWKAVNYGVPVQS